MLRPGNGIGERSRPIRARIGQNGLGDFEKRFLGAAGSLLHHLRRVAGEVSLDDLKTVRGFSSVSSLSTGGFTSDATNGPKPGPGTALPPGVAAGVGGFFVPSAPVDTFVSPDCAVAAAASPCAPTLVRAYCQVAPSYWLVIPLNGHSFIPPLTVKVPKILRLNLRCP